MISRLVGAAVVAVVVYLVCIFVGGLLAQINLPVADFVGAFIKTYAVVLAILAALWYFVKGGVSW